MASQNPNLHKAPFYPHVIHNDPNLQSTSDSRPNLYPTIDEKDLTDEKLIPDNYEIIPSAPPESHEETLLVIPGVLIHLIDKHYSVELATGDLYLFRLLQDKNTVAILARVGDEIQWPLTKDLTAVKLDDSHYFFSFQALIEDHLDSSDDEKEKGKKKKEKGKKEKEKGPMDDTLNYGLTIASKGQEKLLKELDVILKSYSRFSVQKVEEKAALAMGGTVARELSPEDLKSEKKKEILEERCAQYWTTLAPNVEEYSGLAAKLVAQGSGQLIKGILWCGDVSVERLKRGNDILKQRMATGTKAEISPETLKRIKRVKRVTKMTEKVALGVLSGVLQVSGFFTSSVVNSIAGKKFFKMLPGEMVLATLDGFCRICDAVEVAGKNVMSTSSTVTTELVQQKYGDEAAKVASEGLDAAGHAVGTAWTVFKIRKALNPKSSFNRATQLKSSAKAATIKKANSSKY
ncbi:protein EARLY-RESPONSIVE TO DEHYDRATION 7, chloroplastic-like [Lycium ferocissimum]|uniref:protein EARLY-RESPONSIVE TO DEHYDRATION 7, chloroplastic-like n=1 Tax=Lycium ferocissimum TaxID=112874 RepID=UPI002814F7A9|nr:protein EARLY-RESPONSIVE TO DEHYDRATION 7, chloroplastic-like [Lycium ferocissimum]